MTKGEKIEEILEYYSRQRDKKEQSVIVEMLRELQDAEGALDGELKQRAAEAAGVDIRLIDLLVRMYPSLKEHRYEHEIVACTGERCGRKGGGEILRVLKKELRIGKDGVSADGKIKLRTQNCFKQCRTSPNIKIDGEIYRTLTPDKVKDIIRKW